jgi:hypothetical protein
MKKRSLNSTLFQREISKEGAKNVIGGAECYTYHVEIGSDTYKSGRTTADENSNFDKDVTPCK